MHAYLGKLLRNIAAWPLHLSSLVVPRSRDIWVFGAWFGHRYSDNSSYLFEFVANQVPSVRAVWLTRDPSIVQRLRAEDREVYLSTSLAGFWVACRAGVTFMTCGLEDVARLAASRTNLIQLWHGTPLKRIKMDDRIHEHRNQSTVFKAFRWLWLALFPFLEERCDMLISPSTAITPRLQTAFGLDESAVVVTGYPRGDVILAHEPRAVPAVEAHRARHGARRSILYAPTHRSESVRRTDIFEGLDVIGLEKLLEDRNAVLFIKMHYFHRDAATFRGHDWGRSRICWLTEQDVSDINSLLPHVDVLVTDYSSVYFDFLLLDRPIVFLPLRHEEYLSHHRSLYDDYDSVTPGPKCHSWGEALSAIDAALAGQDDFGPSRLEMQARFNEFRDTRNCERVVAAVKKRLHWADFDETR